MSIREIPLGRIRMFCLVLLASAWVFAGGCQSIQVAARKGDLKEVERQLAQGVNVNSRTFRMRTAALHEAASEGRVEIVKLLLEKGANPDILDEGSTTPLAYAACGGHVEVMEILIAHGADPAQRRVMELAAMGGHIEPVEVLLEHGVDINVKGTDEATGLIVAVSHRRRELVKFLLSRGADVNARAIYGKTPLWSAYYKGDVTIGRILLQHGADPTLECNGRKIPQSFLEQLRR